MDQENQYITKVGKILSRQKNPDRHTLVSIFKPEAVETREHGVIYMIIEILSSDPTMARITKLIEKILIEKYYEDLGDGLASFESALKAINEKLSSLADDGEIGWIGKINAVIGILEKNILHVTQTGTTEAYLIRENKIIHITENLSTPSEKPNPLKTFINIVSGNLNLGDKVIISTSELFYHFSLDDLRRICTKFPPAIAAAYIVKMLRREEIESINTLILELGEKEGEFNLEEMGKKIFSNSEQKIIEGYKNIVPFWKKFLKVSKKGLNTSLEKSKDIYSKKLVPNVSKFAQEATKKVNERIEKMTEKEEIKPLKKSKAEKNLNNLVPDFKKDKKMDLFENAPKKDLMSVPREVFKKVKIKSPVFMILGILLIVLLAVSGLISYQKRNTLNKRTQIEQAYNSLKTKIESAIKANEFGDSKKAQSLLNEAKADAAKFPSSGYLKTEELALEKQIQDSMELIFNIKRMDSITPLVDFSQLDPTIKLSNVFTIGNKLYVIDKERHKAATYSFDDKSTVSLDNLSFDGESQKLALLNDKNSIALLANNPDGIFIYNSKTNSTEKASQLTGDAWPKAKSISTYMNNLYLLVPSDSQIYKYSALVGSYSNKNNYIINTNGAKLDGATDLAIDGSIYILTNTGDVYKFTSGERNDFVLTNMPDDSNAKEKSSTNKMVNAIRIITNADMNNIYIADAGAKKVIVFDKDGKYISQYTSNLWTDIKDIWISSDKKLYVLSGTSVYEVNLK